MEKKKRLEFLDEYRGFVVLNMIAYHAIWDLVYIFGVDWTWYKSDLGKIWQQWICWSFILLSGFCWQMGRKHLRRGLEVFFAGGLVTLVTIVFMPESKIVFGVLTLLGSSMLLMIPLDKILRKVNAFVGVILSFFLFLFTYNVNSGYVGFGNLLGFGGLFKIELPETWYANSVTTYLGFMEKGFFSTDYFSLLPWFFLFVTGYFLYKIVFEGTDTKNVQKEKVSQIASMLQKSICPPLAVVGRNALVIYLLHQPVVYGLLTLGLRN